ncbi:MAG: ribbon-helix-helix domain-containing protein [Candidatus Bathyarchaeota archaeon]|nr:ribbon-helix-helix domain-containing protein [Candidatus Bathyarchaeota archaeon]
MLMGGKAGVKTLRISDDVHQKLTALLGELTAQTSRLQTYQDAIEALLNQSVLLPPELLNDVEKFIEENRRLGYMTREEFIRDAVRWRLKMLREEIECIEIPREKYEKLNKAVKKMRIPYRNAAEFIEEQIDKAIEQYEEYIKEKEE